MGRDEGSAPTRRPGSGLKVQQTEVEEQADRMLSAFATRGPVHKERGTREVVQVLIRRAPFRWPGRGYVPLHVWARPLGADMYEVSLSIEEPALSQLRSAVPGVVQQQLFLTTERASIRSDVGGWGAEDPALVDPDPRKPIGLSRSWDGSYPSYGTPVHALADGWRLLAPPVQTGEGERDPDGSGAWIGEEWSWWLVREVPRLER